VRIMKKHAGAGAGGAVYGIGFFGALIYYLQNAVTFGQGVFGVVKAIVWPGILIYKVFEVLHL